MFSPTNPSTNDQLHGTKPSKFRSSLRRSRAIMNFHHLPQAVHKDKMIVKMKALADLLERQCIRRHITEQAKAQGARDDCAVRYINGNRLEIFVRSDVHQTCVYKYLQSRLPPEHRLDAAHYQKYIEEVTNTSNHRFAAFSIVVSYHESAAQNVHIDMVGDDKKQYIVLLSDQSFGTQVAIKQPKIESIKDAWPDAPTSLTQQVDGDDYSRSLVWNYGAVFCDLELTPCESKPRGTVYCLSGNRAHCGPPSKTFRAVLFCSSCPVSAPIHDDYDSNGQWSRASLCCALVFYWWDELDALSRRYLLRQTVLAAVTESARSCVTDGYRDNKTPFMDFLRAVEELSLQNTEESKTRLEALLASDLKVQVRDNDFTNEKKNHYNDEKEGKDSPNKRQKVA